MSTYRYCANIDLDAFGHNIDEIQRHIGEDTMLCCVIKANAYGHGAVTLAQYMEKRAVDWFAVACVDEGIELRQNGITTPVLVLGETDESQFDALMTYDITPTIFTYASACALNEAAEKRNRTVNIHIKVDTGMSRIGFMAGEACIDDIVRISELSNLCLQGIFTHFACADMDGQAPTNLQIQRYNRIIESLNARGIHIPIRHCSNSAGIMEYPHANMNMVRAGIIIYGLYPSEEVHKDILDLKPVMSLKSHVTFIKEIPAGTGVSYGATFVTERPTVVATIPVGYADGYMRGLSNKGRVLINGQSAPIIGRVCMDQMMADITELEGIKEGDTVTLAGRDGDAEISVEEIAALAGSFNYEFVCDVARRVPRAYYEGSKKIKEVHYLFQVS